MAQRSSIHRTLIIRLVIAALCIAAVVMALVLWVEMRNIDTVVKNQAAAAGQRLRWAIMEDLDAPGLGDHDRIRRTLEKPLSVKARPPGGHFVLVRILDTDYAEAAAASDPSYEHFGAAKACVAAGMDRSALQERGTWEKVSRVDGSAIIHLASALENSRGEHVGYAEGVYAVSPAVLARARLQAAVVALVAALIVLLTALLLYPVITRLLRRVSGLTDDLLHANMEILNVLGSAIAKRDSDTDIHNYRVTIYAIRLGQETGLSDDEMRALIKGAFLHDVGKIGIRDSILLKPGNLTEEEFEEMKQHVRHGRDIVGRSSWLSDAAPVVVGHHERYDGSGYIEGRRGSDIPKVARVFAVADVFDALTSKRPYKEALGFGETMAILARGRGTHFDPGVLDAFVKIAPSLYEAYVARDDARPRHDLRERGRRYFVDKDPRGRGWRPCKRTA